MKASDRPTFSGCSVELILSSGTGTWKTPGIITLKPGNAPLRNTPV